MKKDFNTWHTQKKKINAQSAYLPFYHERQIRWCRLGVNIGYEQDGTGRKFSRPVLVLKGFSRHVCVIIPLTTANKQTKYYVLVGRVDGRSASAIISQVRLIDTKRLDQHIATLDKQTFADVKKAVKDAL